MKISRIVLTGGPCAGKSTALERVRDEFEKHGYRVITVSETPTEIISSGISPQNAGSILDFELAIMRLQKQKEFVYDELAKTLPDENILIVYDRGMLDFKGYMSEEEFEEACRRIDMTELEMLEKYQGVFHLVSTAKGAEKYYTLANNKARYETLDEAKAADDRGIEIWKKHPYFRIIDNSTGFDQKMDRLISEIKKMLNEPSRNEFRRSYLIELPDFQKIPDGIQIHVSEILLTHLASDDSIEKSIRQRGLPGGELSFYLSTRSKETEQPSIEIEQSISKNEYLDLLMDADTSRKQIRKIRHTFLWNNQIFEIDIYPDLSNKAVLEIITSSPDEKPDLPDFIKILEEIPLHKNDICQYIKTENQS